MLTKKMKENFEENKRAYIVAGVLVGAGILIGLRVQKRIDIKNFNQKLKGASILRKELSPMFPDTMPLSEIKDILSKIDGAQFFDALVTDVHGVKHLIIRN
ncbi:MAG: hypothetical protein RBT15_04800 [Gudongella sp.]|jgi:hypothetical protein|nr:hypothetical protein [Gudongella sp.]